MAGAVARSAQAWPGGPRRPRYTRAYVASRSPPTRARFVILLVAVPPALAQTPPAVAADAERRIEAVLKPVIAWRRDFHQHPELGMQEMRTSKLVADHLRSLGLEVQVGVPGRRHRGRRHR